MSMLRYLPHGRAHVIPRDLVHAQNPGRLGMVDNKLAPHNRPVECHRKICLGTSQPDSTVHDLNVPGKGHGLVHVKKCGLVQAEPVCYHPEQFAL